MRNPRKTAYRNVTNRNTGSVIHHAYRNKCVKKSKIKLNNFRQDLFPKVLLEVPKTKTCEYKIVLNCFGKQTCP